MYCSCCKECCPECCGSPAPRPTMNPGVTMQQGVAMVPVSPRHGSAYGAAYGAAEYELRSRDGPAARSARRAARRQLRSGDGPADPARQHGLRWQAAMALSPSSPLVARLVCRPEDTGEKRRRADGDENERYVEREGEGTARQGASAAGRRRTARGLTRRRTKRNLPLRDRTQQISSAHARAPRALRAPSTSLLLQRYIPARAG